MKNQGILKSSLFLVSLFPFALDNLDAASADIADERGRVASMPSAASSGILSNIDTPPLSKHQESSRSSISTTDGVDPDKELTKAERRRILREFLNRPSGARRAYYDEI
jgi:hypothetical protein